MNNGEETTRQQNRIDHLGFHFPYEERLGTRHVTEERGAPGEAAAMS